MAGGGYVSLGAFGGYIVAGFDHSVDASADGYELAVGGIKSFIISKILFFESIPLVKTSIIISLGEAIFTPSTLLKLIYLSSLDEYTYIQFHFPMNSFIILTAYYSCLSLCALSLILKRE